MATNKSGPTFQLGCFTMLPSSYASEGCKKDQVLRGTVMEQNINLGAGWRFSNSISTSSNSSRSPMSSNFN